MANKKETLEQSQKALAEFFTAAKYLLGADAPYDVNEIPEDNPCYEMAKSISDEMGLDWNSMEHADSNSVVLNVLAEYFCSIKTDDSYEPVLTISFKKTN